MSGYRQLNTGTGKQCADNGKTLHHKHVFYLFVFKNITVTYNHKRRI